MSINRNYRDSIPESNIIIFDIAASKAKAEAAYTRRIIRKSDFTRAERDILIAVVNLWFYHRNGKKGFIHPGRELLAKKAKASVKTVSRALNLFKSLNLLTPVKYENGGTGCATQYFVRLNNIWEYLDPDNVKMLAGELELVRRQSGTFEGANCTVNVPLSGGQNVPLSISTLSPTFSNVEDDNHE